MNFVDKYYLLESETSSMQAGRQVGNLLRLFVDRLLGPQKRDIVRVALARVDVDKRPHIKNMVVDAARKHEHLDLLLPWWQKKEFRSWKGCPLNPNPCG